MTDTVGLVTISDPMSPASEAYRTLRMNIQFSSLDNELRTLLVTSPGAGEGKSTTLANLAVTMAQVDQRVILVDCDLRKPHLHTFFGLSNDVGLTTMMVDDRALETPPLLETSIKDLFILPSGPEPPRPADLLGSKRMEAILRQLLEMADIVLLDAPPVMAAADAAVLATKAEGVLLVVSAGETKREHAERAIEQLRKVNAHVVGAVISNAPREAGLNSYYR